jgi:hypothetical protein
MPVRRGKGRQKVGEQDKKSEERNWENLNTLFNYPADDSARKVNYLGIQTAAKKVDHADTKLEGSTQLVYTLKGHRGD